MTAIPLGRWPFVGFSGSISPSVDDDRVLEGERSGREWGRLSVLGALWARGGDSDVYFVTCLGEKGEALGDLSCGGFALCELDDDPLDPS